MNIVFYNFGDINPIRGGTERVTFILSEALERLGHHCVYISRISNGDKDDEVGNKQYFLPDSTRLASDDNENYCHQFFSDHKIDVLINQDGKNIESLFFSRTRFPEVKVVSAIHFDLFGDLYHLEDRIKEQYIKKETHAIKYYLKRILLPYYRIKSRKSLCSLYQKLSETSDKIVLLSKGDYDNYPINDKRMLRVIPNPLTLQPLQSTCSKKDKIVLFVGRMVYNQKRVDYFLKIWKKVQDKNPDWRAEVLGGGPLLSYYQKMAHKMHLRNINFRGFVNPREYYQKASVMCMTSTYEGFGLVLLEALAHGCIPIAFNSFSNAQEIIKNETNGYLIPPYDLNKYSLILDMLMSDENSRNNVRSNSKDFLYRFSIENVMKQWQLLLQQL